MSESDLSPMMDSEVEGPLIIDSMLTPTQTLLNNLMARFTLEGQRTVPGLYGVSTLGDIQRIQENREHNLDDLLSSKAIEEIRRSLLMEHEYPISEYTTYEEAMYHHTLHEQDPFTSASIEEWTIIMTLGAAEQCQRDGWDTSAHTPNHFMTVTMYTLGRSVDQLVIDAAAYVPRIQELHAAH
ncbi:hypothetical protein B0H19DRAFT_1071617 [Mycena capillaripes]|nr:hypothetical protein B0H19DRAFT_1071617 [Mycena capillaripes]